MLSHRFHAMGTEIELLLDTDDDRSSFAQAEQEFHRLEALFSRFRADSELSRLNHARELRVGPELLELTELALAARARTGGRFDPTVHDALVQAGYDRSIEQLAEDSPAPVLPPSRCNGRVEVDHATRKISLDDGVSLDFGGIAKGWAADRALELLARRGPALVNAGGDLAATERPWPVGVGTATDPLTLELDGGAVATSGRDRRRWNRNGREHHHLIDPATARPAEGDVLAVTVVAATAAEAEVWATAAFLAGGAAQAADEADERAVPTVIVTREGRTLLAGGLA
jgi:thiamine biosynthesis lipoprotein